MQEKISTSYFSEMNFILGSEKRKVPFVVLLFLFSSLIEIIGIGLIAPYIGIIINPDMFFESRMYSFLAMMNFPDERDQIVILLGSILMVIFVLKFFVAININRLILRFSAKQGARLCAYLMKSFQSINEIKNSDKNDKKN